MSAPLATRRVGRRVDAVSAAGQLYVFGPFLPGEGVSDLVVALAADRALGASDASDASITAGVTTHPPASLSTFLLHARLLTDGASRATFPGLPVGGGQPEIGTLTAVVSTTDSNAVTVTGTIAGTISPIGADAQASPYTLPLGWIATAEDRYLGVAIYGPTAGNVRGSLWIRTCGSPDPSPVVPPSPGVVAEDCE